MKSMKRRIVQTAISHSSLSSDMRWAGYAPYKLCSSELRRDCKVYPFCKPTKPKTHTCWMTIDPGVFICLESEYEILLNDIVEVIWDTSLEATR